jgi:hypothetical protein
MSLSAQLLNFTKIASQASMGAKRTFIAGLGFLGIMVLCEPVTMLYAREHSSMPRKFLANDREEDNGDGRSDRDSLRGDSQAFTDGHDRLLPEGQVISAESLRLHLETCELLDDVNQEECLNEYRVKLWESLLDEPAKMRVEDFIRHKMFSRYDPTSFHKDSGYLQKQQEVQRLITTSVKRKVSWEKFGKRLGGWLVERSWDTVEAVALRSIALLIERISNWVVNPVAGGLAWAGSTVGGFFKEVAYRTGVDWVSQKIGNFFSRGGNATGPVPQVGSQEQYVLTALKLAYFKQVGSALEKLFLNPEIRSAYVRQFIEEFDKAGKEVLGAAEYQNHRKPFDQKELLDIYKKVQNQFITNVRNGLNQNLAEVDPLAAAEVGRIDIEEGELLAMMEGVRLEDEQFNQKVQKVKDLHDHKINGRQNIDSASATLQQKLALDFKYVINELKNWRWPGLFTSPFEQMKEAHQFLTEKYKRYVDTLPADFQYEIVKGLDKTIADYLENHIEARNVQAENKFEPYQAGLTWAFERRQQIFLSLPLTPRDLTLSGRRVSEEKRLRHRAEIMLKLDYLIKTYPKASQGRFQSFVDKILANSNPHSTDVSRVVAHFEGDPGVGKNRFVYALGNILGLYVCSVKRPQDKKDAKSLEEILQGSSARQGFNKDDKEAQKLGRDSLIDGSEIGEIAACAIRAGHNNFIVFLDEFFNSDVNEKPKATAGGMYYPNFGAEPKEDFEELRRFLKIAFDPEVPSLELKKLHVSYPTLRITWIFSSNVLPEGAYDEGVRDRIDVFRFGALEEGQKRAAIRDNIRFKIGEKRKAGKLSGQENAAFFEALEKVMLSMEDDLYLADLEINPSGARQLLRWINDLILAAAKDYVDRIPLSKNALKRKLRDLVKIAHQKNEFAPKKKQRKE